MMRRLWAWLMYRHTRPRTLNRRIMSPDDRPEIKDLYK